VIYSQRHTEEKIIPTDFIADNAVKHHPVTELVCFTAADHRDSIGLADHCNHGRASPAVDRPISEHGMGAEKNQIDTSKNGPDRSEEDVGAIDAYARE
jgi:hypothetical protein